MDIALSHHNQSLRAKLVVALLDQVSARHFQEIQKYVPLLQDLSLLTGKAHSEVSLRVREMLIRIQLPSFAQRRATVENFLLATAQLKDDTERLRRVHTLVDESASIFDVLLSLLCHDNDEIRKLALEAYVRRTYRTYVIHHFALYSRKLSASLDDLLLAEFRFAQPEDVHSAPSTSTSAAPSSPSSSPSSSSSFSGAGTESSPRLRPSASFSLTQAAQRDMEKSGKAVHAELPMVSPESADDLMRLERARLLAPPSSSSSSSSSSSGSTAGQERVRYGLVIVFRTLDEVKERFEAAMQHYIPPPHHEGEELLHVLGLILPSASSAETGERVVVPQLTEFLREKAALLRESGVRRVTAVFGRGDNHPECFTFRERLE